MQELTLGLNFFGGHDTSVFTLFDDDCYGLSQERITRIKHDAIFPIDTIYEMLRYKQIDPENIRKLHIGVATLAFQKRRFSEYSYELTTSLRKMIQGDKEALYIKEFIQAKEALLQSPLPKKLAAFLGSRDGRAYLWYQLTGKQKPLEEIIRGHLSHIFPNAVLDIDFYEHHLTHAYAAYYASSFEDTLVFTFDGEGDGAFSKLYSVKSGVFKELGKSENRFVPNMQVYDFADSGMSSVGNIYSIFTHLLGFTPNADEGKVEALAAFGNAQNPLLKHLLDAHRIDGDKLSIETETEKLDALFAKENLDTLFKTLSREDIAAAVQRFTEEIMLAYLCEVKERYPKYTNLVLAGGVTANVIVNMKIFENLYDHLFITPAMGDDGISQGACVLKYLENHPDQAGSFRFPPMPYYGSSYTKEEILPLLEKSGLAYSWLGDDAYIKAAHLLCEGKIGALFHGRCEFGPRALGNRSIIADVRDEQIQKHINQNIKNRPLFQPFCPSILEEERERLFEKSYANKHMTIAFRLKEEHKAAIPGAIHVDLTARAQFVTPEDNPLYYALIKEVQKQTGYGVIIDTSFNRHGRTMVLSPRHALQDFIDTNLDYLVIEGYLVTRRA